VSSDTLLRSSYDVRLFDETDLIPSEHKTLLNERLKEMQTRFNLQALQFHDAQKKIYTRLQNFERLKPAQYGLLDMTVD
jgi:hypothetical protein